MSSYIILIIIVICQNFVKSRLQKIILLCIFQCQIPYNRCNHKLHLIWRQYSYKTQITILRAILEWLEKFFRPNGGLIASGHCARRGTNGGFQPMQTRHVSGMTAISPTAWRLEDGASTGLSETLLCRTAWFMDMGR